MIGVTLSLGSIVVAAATNQFGLVSNSDAQGASLRADAAGMQLGMAFYAVRPSTSCPAYGGTQEGTNLTVALYDFGGVGFTPAGFVVNATVHPGMYGEVGPGALVEYTLALGGCAHASGLTVLAYDAQGDEVQFAT